MHPTDRVTSYLRTAVPIFWGWLIAQVVTAWPAIPDYAVEAVSTPAMVTAVTAAATLLWYVIWRAVEPRLPAWATRLVLGSNQEPTYAGPFPVATYSTGDRVKLTDGTTATINEILMSPGAERASYNVTFLDGSRGVVFESEIVARE